MEENRPNTSGDAELARRLQDEEDLAAYSGAAPAAMSGVPLVPGPQLGAIPVVVDAQPIWGGRRIRTVAVPSRLLLIGYPACPPGTQAGGSWVEASFFGAESACCCCLWSLVFFPIALLVPFFPCDTTILYRDPSGRFWYPDGRFAGLVYT